jgi:HEAT repeat protein
MKKLRLLLLGLLVVGIVFWLARLPGGLPDPQYQGRHLSSLLAITNNSLTMYSFGGSFEGGRMITFDKMEIEAIRHIGTNALPFLLHELSAHDSAFVNKLRQWADKQSVIKLRHTAAPLRQLRALDAFRVLGPVAEPAIPALVKLIDKPDWTTAPALKALGGIGTRAVPVLTNALTHTNAFVRRTAAETIAQYAAHVLEAVPILIRSLSDADAGVRAAAATSLGLVEWKLSTSVPALAKCLEDPDPKVRQAAAGALSNFGPKARPAVPALLKAFDTADQDTRTRIHNALRIIDSAAAAQAGFK